MSFTALMILVVILLALAPLHVWINSRYRLALTSVVEKQGGVLSYYRVRVGNAFHMQERSAEGFACLVHFLLLHLVAPFFLSGLILHTDWNFLVAVGTILTSAQLFQRVYPGEDTSGESD